MTTTYSALEEIRDRLTSEKLSATDVFNYRITLLNACSLLFLASEKITDSIEKAALLEQYTLLQQLYHNTNPQNRQVDTDARHSAIEAINQVISQLTVH